MYIFESATTYNNAIVKHLKNIGVDLRLPKKTREEKQKSYPKEQVFQKPLKFQDNEPSTLRSGVSVNIPVFILRACACLEQNIDVEGVFRKAGSAIRQRETKKWINNGNSLSNGHYVYDTANLLKQFLRELPQPLLPYEYHDIILRCLLLDKEEKKIEALLASCLLLPKEHLFTLAFLMEHLKKISEHSDRNKMSVKNLAIVITPSIMPMSKNSLSNSTKFNYHVRVIELLIENCEQIGIVPQVIITNSEQLTTGEDKMMIKKKGKRSNSITNVLSEIKKMVGNRSGAVTPDSLNQTDMVTTSGQKRKATQSYFSNKKIKRLIQPIVPANTPFKTRMSAYESRDTAKRAPEIVYPSNLHRARSRSHSPKKMVKRANSERLTDSGGRTFGAQKWMTKKLKKSENVVSCGELPKSSLERRLSLISWARRKRKSADNLPRNQSESNFFLDQIREITSMDTGVVDLSVAGVVTHVAEEEPNYVKVSKSEYEEIKTRVSAIEKRISREFDNINIRTEPQASVETVQLAYQQTLEDVEPLDNSTDQLAKRLGKELNIRNKVIRSPSARKIGTIRRRSRELSAVKDDVPKLCRTLSGPILQNKSSLKRGRPNTVNTGLPSPGPLRATSNQDIRQSLEETWKSGEVFFTDSLLPQAEHTVRSSIIQLRSQNAGQVLAKAKMFSSMNSSQENESSEAIRRPIKFSRTVDNNPSLEMKRRQSVRLESLRKQLSTQKKRTNRQRSSEEKENVVSPPKLNNQTTLPASLHRLAIKYASQPTPAIKQTLVTRSPRSIVKTPARCRNTPMKTVVDSTPHRGFRRSPRLLALTNSARKFL